MEIISSRSDAMKKLFLYLFIFITIFICFFILGRFVFYKQIYEKPDSTEITESSESAVSVSNQEQKANKYIITIINDKVVVYKDSLNNLYEETDIDAEILKLTNNEIYKQLKNTVILNDEKQMYKFLESISS